MAYTIDYINQRLAEIEARTQDIRDAPQAEEVVNSLARRLGPICGSPGVNYCHRAYSKSLWRRNDAWRHLVADRKLDPNPWRKAHTEHYWVWYRVLDEATS